MKRISLLLTSLVLCCCWVGAQNEKISFNETDHNFGVIGEKDGNATFEFILTNNSNAPVVVSNAVASCGCTKPVWTKEPIEPGKKGTISVSFNPVGRPGAFDKNVTVYINQLSPISLKIRGTVVRNETIKKKLSPEQEYPVVIGDYRLKSKELNFDQVEGNIMKTIRLEAFNNSDKPITPKTLKLPKYMTVTFNPEIIPAKTAATIDVNLNVQDITTYGNLSGEITFLINNVKQSFPYSAIVIEDFSKWTAAKKADAGKINVSASEINFGNLSSGNSRILKISNSGKSPLSVHNIQSDDPSITVSKAHFTVNPGEITEIKVNVDGKKIQSELSSKLVIITNDPNMPVYEISIIAKR